MTNQRRDAVKRADVFEKVLHHVIENPGASFDLPAFRALLDVAEPTAHRILATLVDAGVVNEVGRGTWARTWADTVKGGRQAYARACVTARFEGTL